MIVEDFTMLGTTVPEPTKSDGRVFVCSAGISPELGLIRIYPLAKRNIPHRWSTYRVPLERNEKDSRKESWKIRGDRSEDAHEHINSAFEEVGKMRRTERKPILSKYVVDSIQEANERKLSLAILQPKIGGLDFEHNPESPDSPMLKLFDLPEQRPVEGAKRFPFIPRLHFKDEGGPHHLMIRDWGCYEWMRKHPDRYGELAQCLPLSDDSSLLIGNFNRHRNSWLIISVLSGIRESEPTLFDFRPRIPT